MSFLTNLSKIFKTTSVTTRSKKEKPIKRQKPKPRIHAGKTSAISYRQIQETKTRAREIILEAKDEAFKVKSESSQQARRIEKEALILKEKAVKKEAEISRKTGALEEREKFLIEKGEEFQGKLSEVEKIKKQQLDKLERVASLTREEAKKLILSAVEKKLTPEIARKIKEAEEESKEKIDEKAKEVLIEAMYRGATDYVSEYTVSSVKLTDEDIKGKIIGKAGRNIRTFERATGVDVDLDEEKIIKLSSFDSVRREIARVALERLIADGRIQPARIEEMVAKTEKEIKRIMYKEGEDLCHKLKVYNLPSEVIAMLGRFKYRFSYGQNLLVHTLEETKIGIALANEIGANVNITRLGCLLHDIGKVITEEEGSHVQTGVNFLRKFDIPKKVLDCVAQHHQDEPFSSNESVLVYIADAISGSRPGARYEDHEEYVARLEKLEKLAKSFKGVKKAYAIQAGREIRVIVNHEKLDDSAAVKLASDLRDKIKKDMTYPGQVKITVIRETRVEKIAK